MGRRRQKSILHLKQRLEKRMCKQKQNQGDKWCKTTKSKTFIDKIKKVQRYYRKRKIIRQLTIYSHENYKPTPHPLIVIDESTYQSIKENCIILTNMRREFNNTRNCSDGGITHFSIASSGRNVKKIFHNICDYSLRSSVSEIDELNKGQIFILCKSDEKCLVDDPNISFVPIKHTLCIYVVLLFCSSKCLNILSSDNFAVWDNKIDLKFLKRFKKSTVKNSTQHHYGSSGQCYSFGVRNSFKKSASGNVTVTQYAGDEAVEMKRFESYLWDNFCNVFQSVDTIIPGFSDKLHLSCRSMIQSSKKNELSEYIRKKETVHDQYNNFLLSGNININAKTAHFHCEEDTTYTTIYIPKQLESEAFIIFEFQINLNNTLRIKFKQNSYFIYSAYCLAHRQYTTGGINCMNLSTYSTKRLFCSYRKSLQRLEKG
jgi:hypothetical protein